MPLHVRILLVIVLSMGWAAGSTGAQPVALPRTWPANGTLRAVEAVQAAAVDGEFIYVVNAAQIGRYRRSTGERLAVSTGDAVHLNSALVHGGKVYCAHSTFPRQPSRSEIKVLDPQSMVLTTFHDFGESDGSLTWCVPHDGNWWCCFAHYGDENSLTYLARFDNEWRELQRWSLPPELVRQLGHHSLSGGVFLNGEWLATGHDDPVLFRLRVPNNGKALQLVGTDQIPLTGQGIAIDPAGGLVGIDRAGKQVVFAAPPAPRLHVLSYNIHHGEGTDRRLELERIATLIRSVEPDLVALQEVDHNVPRSGRIDQAARLAELTGLSAVFGENIPLNGGGYGNAILTRWPVRSEQNHRLPNLDRGEQRGVLDVELAWPNESGSLRFLATHFDHRPDDAERLASAAKVNELAAARPEQPAVLAGDLNDTPDSAALNRLSEQWTRSNADPLPTYPADRPQQQIDYVLLRPKAGWRVLEVRVLDEAIASDHRAQLAVIELQ